jgi:hypothetical protein
MKKNKGIIILVACIILIIAIFLNSYIQDSFLRKNHSCIKAQLYKDVFGGKTRPSFKYYFVYKNKEYTGLVVKDDVLKIGDSICVIYLEKFPSVNRPLSYFDSGEIKCDCK